MSSLSLSFSLRTSSSVKTVHLIGSWDGYKSQLPLSMSKDKKGSWKGTFRFQSKAMKPGQRYWYYYQMDGYSVTHDPSKEFTVEPTTGRKLNILDVPAEKDKKGSSASSKHESRRHSREIPRGRPATEIKCPKPYRPGQTQHIVNQEYTQATLEALTARFAAQNIDDESEFEEDEESDDDSDCSFGSAPSLTSSTSSRSSNCSSPSSVSSDCSCDRYGITRSGDRVKLDCGGDICGFSSDGDCSDEEAAEMARYHATRRHGVVIR